MSRAIEKVKAAASGIISELRAELANVRETSTRRMSEMRKDKKQAAKEIAMAASPTLLTPLGAFAVARLVHPDHHKMAAGATGAVAVAATAAAILYNRYAAPLVAVASLMSGPATGMLWEKGKEGYADANTDDA